MNKMVLVVEDQAEYRECIVEDIAGRGREIIAPASPEELRAVLACCRFDAVLLDGNLWNKLKWSDFKNEILASLNPNAIILCISVTDGMQAEMAAGFGCEVGFTEKGDPRLPAGF